VEKRHYPILNKLLGTIQFFTPVCTVLWENWRSPVIQANGTWEARAVGWFVAV
jgi:hypothetical protein